MFRNFKKTQFFIIPSIVFVTAITAQASFASSDQNNHIKNNQNSTTVKQQNHYSTHNNGQNNNNQQFVNQKSQSTNSSTNQKNNSISSSQSNNKSSNNSSNNSSNKSTSASNSNSNTKQINKKLSKVCHKEKGKARIEQTGIFACKIKNNSKLESKQNLKQKFSHPLNSPFVLIIWDIHSNHINNALNIQSQSHKVQKVIKTKNYTLDLYGLDINIVSRKNKNANYKMVSQSVINKIANDTQKEFKNSSIKQ